MKNITSCGFSESEWSTAKQEACATMIDTAKSKTTISYSDLISAIRTIKLEAHGQRLSNMLCEIASEEDANGRGMLTVVVVHKSGDQQPGPGFYELAQKLGRKGDKEEIWINELNNVYDYWSKHSL